MQVGEKKLNEPVRRATLKHVAAAADVSIQTASHILNTGYSEPYRPETRERVLAAARELGYRPNAAARSMLRQGSQFVGAIVPVRRDSWIFPVYVFETVAGMNRHLMERGYVTAVIPFEDLDSPEKESRVFREHTLDGVVVVGHAPDFGVERIAQVAPACIWCDSNKADDVGCVRRDERLSGTLAAEALIGAGYRRIVWVCYSPPPQHYSHAERLAGVQAVAQARGVPVEIVPCAEPSFGGEAARLAGYLRPDTAVLTEHQPFAALVAHAARRARRVPGFDFGLASCDCSVEQSRLWPDLSAVVVDRTQLGIWAAEMLVATIASGGRPPVSRVIRGTWHAGATAPGGRDQ